MYPFDVWWEVVIRVRALHAGMRKVSMVCGMLILLAAVLSLAACQPVRAPSAQSEPVAADAGAQAATTAAGTPFTHTPCPDGVDLTGQTIRFYHVLDPSDQVDTVYNPLRAGYADATEYFNAQGGICGGTIEQIFDDPQTSAWSDPQTVYQHMAAVEPKPAVVMLYGSGIAADLEGQLAADGIVGLDIRGGSTPSAYGEDGKTLGWVFDNNPIYADQVGAMCDYIAANPDRFPNPVLGFLSFEDSWAVDAGEEAHAYCEARGIGYAGTATFNGDMTNIQPHVQKLVDAGATILYTNSHENGPALIARTLGKLGLKGKVTLATLNRAMDAYVAFSGMDDVDSNGVPLLDGMLGSLPMRTLAETGQPGIQVIAEQADRHNRPLTLRTDGYLLGWNTTDLLIETYLQTIVRAGVDGLSGAEFKQTLAELDYAPLGGNMQIDFQGGQRRATPADRIGILHYLGADGENPASASNAPKTVAEGGQQVLVPMIVPLTDYAPAPDLRPGGADFVAASSSTTPDVTPHAAAQAPAATVELAAPASGLGVLKGKLAFQTNRDGNLEIYVMNGDGSGLRNLTNNPADDQEPAWSPDGTKIAFWTNRDGDSEVYVMNADGSDQTRLTHTASEDNQPRWSPDGKQIVFASLRDGNRNIYVMNADGSDQVALTSAATSDELPNWSPDGSKIAFLSDPGGITVMNADGSAPQLIHKGGDAFPFWSPDGKQIAFMNFDSGNAEVFVMDADGQHAVNVTKNPADDGVYGWSSDGSWIAFNSDRTGNSDIFVIKPDGSGLVQITNDPCR